MARLEIMRLGPVWFRTACLHCALENVSQFNGVTFLFTRSIDRSKRFSGASRNLWPRHLMRDLLSEPISLQGPIYGARGWFCCTKRYNLLQIAIPSCSLFNFGLGRGILKKSAVSWYFLVISNSSYFVISLGQRLGASEFEMRPK